MSNHPGWYVDQILDERDAALATLARVRSLIDDWRHEETGRGKESQYGDLPACAADLEAALKGPVTP